MVRVEYQIGEHPKVGSDAFGAFDFDQAVGFHSDAHYIAQAAVRLAEERGDLVERGEPVTFIVIRRPGEGDTGPIPREPGPHRPD